jgi:hypothetical protein
MPGPESTGDFVVPPTEVNFDFDEDASGETTFAEGPDGQDRPAIAEADPNDYDRRPPQEETRPPEQPVRHVDIVKWEPEPEDTSPQRPSSENELVLHQEVPARVQAEVDAMDLRLRQSPVAHMAERMQGQADVAQVGAAYAASLVLQARLESEREQKSEQERKKPDPQRQLEAIKKDPSQIARLITAIPASEGDPDNVIWQVNVRTQLSGTPEEQGEEAGAFFDGLQHTEAEFKTFSGLQDQYDRDTKPPKRRFAKYANDAAQKAFGARGEKAQREREGYDLDNAATLYHMEKGAEPVKALKHIKNFIDGQKLKPDAVRRNLEDGTAPYPPMGPQIKRLESYIRFAYPRIYQAPANRGGGAEAADTMRLEVAKEIFDLREEQRSRGLNIDDKFMAGDRPALDREAEYDRAFMMALNVQFRLRYEDADFSKVVVEELGQHFEGFAREENSRFFYENGVNVFDGASPGLTAEALQRELFVGRTTYRLMLKESPEMADEFATSLEKKLHEAVMGEQAYQDLMENPDAFAVHVGLPFGKANKLLNLEDIGRAKTVVLERMATEASNRQYPKEKDEALLTALLIRETELRDDPLGAAERQLEIERNAALRNAQANRLNSHSVLLVDGPTEEADGKTGAFLAFFMSMPGVKRIDVAGHDTWGNEYISRVLGGPEITQLKGNISGERIYEIAAFEGRLPRAIDPVAFIIDQVEPGGMFMIQVRSQINVTAAEHIISVIDPEAANPTNPNEQPRYHINAPDDPGEYNRRLYWTNRQFGPNDPPYRWALVRSRVWRREEDEHGNMRSVYEHKEYPDREDADWTLVLVRDKDTKGTPSDFYAALKALDEDARQQETAWAEEPTSSPPHPSQV